MHVMVQLTERLGPAAHMAAAAKQFEQCWELIHERVYKHIAQGNCIVQQTH